MRPGLGWALCVVICLTAPARADSDVDAEARQHYKAATGHFAVGEFAQAAAEYEAAFKLHQDPALLFNAAQSRRLAGENQKALVLYKNFLQLYPSSPQIGAVREQIDKLQEAIAAEEKAKTSPPTSTVEPKSNVGEAPPPQQPPPQATTTTTQAPPPSPPQSEKPSVLKKWWLWVAIGGVVVLAIVIPVAVVATQPKWANLPDQGPGPHALTAAPSLPGAMVRW